MCGLVWQSCKVINPKEQIPTYVHIDSFLFDDCLAGVTRSSKITSVAVYNNNKPIGFFDLPATVPIQANATSELELAPAISINGMSSLTSVYPFYRFVTSTLIAEPGKIVNRVPHTCFFKDTKVAYISRFDGAPGFARYSGNRDILTVSDPTLIFEGGTGSIMLTAIGDSSEDSTIKGFAIPAGAAFIEFNYKSEVPFYVGLAAKLGTYVTAEPYYLAGIKPSDHWQKFYMNVADFNAQYKGTSYNFFIKAVLDEGQKSGRLLIDNVQLVTF